MRSCWCAVLQLWLILSNQGTRRMDLSWNTDHVNSLIAMKPFATRQSMAREDIVTFPQYIASSGIFCTCGHVGVFSDERHDSFQKKCFILGRFCYYRSTWPTIQNIPLEAMHYGKVTISSLVHYDTRICWFNWKHLIHPSWKYPCLSVYSLQCQFLWKHGKWLLNISWNMVHLIHVESSQ